MRRSLAALLILTATFAGCDRTGGRIVLAAGTTLVDSRLIERVIAAYPGDDRVSVVAMSSREAFALGDAGSADVLITHLPDAEDQFKASHPGALQESIFTSRFVLAGPSTMPPSVVDAFRHIAREGLPFVSRADGSGTAAKEEEIWALAGIDPSGEPWHSETGQGMGFTLQVADQMEAFTLAEIGTLRSAETLTLEPVVDGDQLLANPYRVTLIAGAAADAATLFEWLISPEGAAAIAAANEELFGEQLYVPATVPS